MTTTTNEYVVIAAGWVAGQRRKAGEIVVLSPEAARYEPLLQPSAPASVTDVEAPDMPEPVPSETAPVGAAPVAEPAPSRRRKPAPSDREGEA